MTTDELANARILRPNRNDLKIQRVCAEINKDKLVSKEMTSEQRVDATVNDFELVSKC